MTEKMCTAHIMNPTSRMSWGRIGAEAPGQLLELQSSCLVFLVFAGNVNAYHVELSHLLEVKSIQSLVRDRCPE